MSDLKTETMPHVAVIGAGISGFSAAWELALSGLHVDVYERDAMPGGLAGWFDVGGTTLEKFYHHIYNKDIDIIELISELGMKDHLIHRATSTGCFYVNKIYSLSSPMDLLRYKPLHFFDRIRLGFLALRARWEKDWKQLDRITAREWIEKYAGRNVYSVLWEPLFRSKFGRYSSEVSAAWLWSKLVQRGGSRSKSGAEELVYFRGGYGEFFKEFERQLLKKDVRIFYQTPVERIVIESGNVKGIVAAGSERAYDAIVAATQLPDYLKTVPDLPVMERTELEKIGFLGNACLVLQMKRRLSDMYWLNITDVNCPFVGVIEQTNLLDESNYGGSHMVYISRYMDTNDPYYAMTAEELFKAYLPYLQKIFPELQESWVENVYLWREPHAQAIVSVGFKDLIPAVRSGVKNLYLTTMAQIFPEDRQMSNGVKMARQAARFAVQDLVSGNRT